MACGKDGYCEWRSEGWLTSKVPAFRISGLEHNNQEGRNLAVVPSVSAANLHHLVDGTNLLQLSYEMTLKHILVVVRW